GPARLRENGIPVFDRLDTATKAIAAYMAAPSAQHPAGQVVDSASDSASGAEAGGPGLGLPDVDLTRPEHGLELLIELERRGIPTASMTEHRQGTNALDVGA